MKVLLLTNVQGQGKKGDIIDVNMGYARNYLIPKKLAVEATASVMNEIKQKAAREKKEHEKELALTKEIAKKIEEEETVVTARCGQGKMFGSVTSGDIQKALASRGFDVDKRKIVLKEPIKELGSYIIEVKLLPSVSADIKLTIVADNN